MLRYAITDISRNITHPQARIEAFRAATRRWAAVGIDYIQLREKSLSSGELFTLAEAMMTELRQAGARTKLLINGRADLAIAAGCGGVHLTAAPGALYPAQVRELFAARGLPAPIVSLSCHSPEEAAKASRTGADLILFGPVFEKVAGETTVAAGSGVANLAHAVRVAGSTSVLALGGITPANTAECLAAGAAGIAAIRLFR